MNWIRQRIKRLIVGIVGVLVLILGVIGFINPLPFGIILLPLGFLILGTQFPWAKKLLRGIEDNTGPVGRKIKKAEKTAAQYMKRIQKKAKRDRKQKVVKNLSDLPTQKKMPGSKKMDTGLN